MNPKRYIIPVFVPHIGCPNACVFCNQKRISGQQKPQTAQSVTDTIKRALEIIPDEAKKEVAFYGGSFTAIPIYEQQLLLDAALPFLQQGKVSSVRLSTRPDSIDADTVSRLKKYNVETVELGCQSMREDVLEKTKRGHSPQDVEHAVKLLKEAGINIILQMMTGLPGDTPEGAVYTAEKLAQLKPDGVRIYPTVVVRDTELCDMWQRGEYEPHSVDDAVELCATLCEVFEKRGIKVIRVGLNPTQELSEGAAVAGAYHPALGEMVKSRIYLRKMRLILAPLSGSKKVVLGVAPGQISSATGQKRCNIKELEKRFDIGVIKVREAAVAKGEIIIVGIENNA